MSAAKKDKIKEDKIKEDRIKEDRKRLLSDNYQKIVDKIDILEHEMDYEEDMDEMLDLEYQIHSLMKMLDYIRAELNKK